MMPATIMSTVTPDTSWIEGVLPQDKNCVAKACSRLLGVNVYVTINFFLTQRWIKKASDLQHDEMILSIIDNLGLEPVCRNVSLATASVEIQKKADGRFFAINSYAHDFPSDSAIGHAFVIIKQSRRDPRQSGSTLPKGALGIVGNNSDKTEAPYHQKINDSHRISVWGPVAWTPYYGRARR